MIKKILKISGRIFGFFLISLMIGYGIFLLNAKLVMHDELPMLGGYGCAVVLSGSMEPEISVNDFIIIKQSDEYCVNDVITYIDEYNDPVTHRIVKISGSEITTKGDANNTRDPSIQSEQVKGKVVCVLPKVGYVISFMQNPFFVVTVIALALFLMERSYSKEKKQKNEEIEAIQNEINALKSDIDSARQSDEIDNSEKPQN